MPFFVDKSSFHCYYYFFPHRNHFIVDVPARQSAIYALISGQAIFIQVLLFTCIFTISVVGAFVLHDFLARLLCIQVLLTPPART